MQNFTEDGCDGEALQSNIFDTHELLHAASMLH